MTRSIPAHIEDGRMIPDGTRPDEVRSVAIVVETASSHQEATAGRKKGDMQTWLEEARALREKMRLREGVFADSAPDIAEDRMAH